MKRRTLIRGIAGTSMLSMVGAASAAAKGIEAQEIENLESDGVGTYECCPPELCWVCDKSDCDCCMCLR